MENIHSTVFFFAFPYPYLALTLFLVTKGAIMHRLHKMLLDDKPVRLSKPKPAEEEVPADDDDQEPQKPDILKPVSQDANLDEIEAEDDDSEGEEHVSEGKIAEPPVGNEDIERPDGGKPVAAKKEEESKTSATYSHTQREKPGQK